MGADVAEGKSREPLEVLNALARQARDGIPDPAPPEHSAGWAKVAAQLGAREARYRTRLRWGIGAALTAAAVAGTLVLVPALRARRSPPEPVPLAYQIDGGNVVDGGYLREAGPGGIKLRFAEGTLLSFAPGTRARLRSVSSTGAKLAIEHGRASFYVTRRQHADWSVDVGPFVVTVKGTAFKVAWDAVTERFDLDLEHGTVAVSGPMSGGEVLLAAGQRLAVDLPRKQTLISEPGSDVTAASATLPQPTFGGDDRKPGDAVARPPDDAAALAPPSERPAPPARPELRLAWAGAVAAGDWDRILADADRIGARQALARASSDELLALADAARYRRRNDLASAALLAQRRRFPGTTAAHEAAYLLGRLAESGSGGMQQALRWYDTYLAAAPSGPYAAEALGRKMTVTHELRGPGTARPLADEYLRRFPTGSYAGAARALLHSAP